MTSSLFYDIKHVHRSNMCRDERAHLPRVEQPLRVDLVLEGFRAGEGNPEAVRAARRRARHFAGAPASIHAASVRRSSPVISVTLPGGMAFERTA
jgi:hypothetical protein